MYVSVWFWFWSWISILRNEFYFEVSRFNSWGRVSPTRTFFSIDRKVRVGLCVLFSNSKATENDLLAIPVRPISNSFGSVEQGRWRSTNTTNLSRALNSHEDRFIFEAISGPIRSQAPYIVCASKKPRDTKQLWALAEACLDVQFVGLLSHRIAERVPNVTFS